MNGPFRAFETRQGTASTRWSPTSTPIARLTAAGLSFRSEVVPGAGGRQIFLADPAGNLVELFRPAH